jgi:hypothetical protein
MRWVKERAGWVAVVSALLLWAILATILWVHRVKPLDVARGTLRSGCWPYQPCWLSGPLSGQGALRTAKCNSCGRTGSSEPLRRGRRGPSIQGMTGPNGHPNAPIACRRAWHSVRTLDPASLRPEWLVRWPVPDLDDQGQAHLW